jgi:hypothetical protein
VVSDTFLAGFTSPPAAMAWLATFTARQFDWKGSAEIEQMVSTRAGKILVQTGF